MDRAPLSFIRRSLAILATSTALSAAATGSPAQAQQVPGATADPSSPASQVAQQAGATTPPLDAPPARDQDQPSASDVALGDIVVTATRQAESLQKVPISLQALSSERLEQREVKGLSDFAALLPSVSFAGIGPGRNTPFFRGIVPAGGNYASVGFYLDDIPITGVNPPDIHVYDVERIEALSGPQGTLYGAGSLAGTIRFITNKPNLDRLEAGYDVETNKYGKGAFGTQIQSFLNIPISSTIAARVMGYYRHDGGFIDNKPNNGRLNDGTSSILNLGDNVASTSYTLNNASIARDDYNPIYEYGGRVQLLWEVTPEWTVLPEVTAQRQISYGYFGYDPRVGDLAVHDYDLTRQDDKWYQAQLSIHGHIGDFDLVSATGYYQRKTILRNDYTYYTVTYDRFGPGYENYLQFFNKNSCTGSGASYKCSSLISPTQYFHGVSNQRKFTQELRLTTPKSWPFDVTLGGFYQRQANENNSYYAIHGLDQIAGYTQAGGQESNPAGFGIPVQYGGTMVLGTPAVKSDGFYVVENNQLYHDEAVFAEGHYNITPKLKFTGGIRYFWTDSATVGFAGVAASAVNTVTSLYVPTGARGCPVPLPITRLTCLNSNFAAADEVGRYKEQGETHKVTLNWQFTPTKMVYANYSTGFRPGGFNRPLRIRGVGVATVMPYQSELLTNYEIGLKTSWNNIFRFNAAAYIEDWDRIQYSVVVAGTQGAGITGNAGKARVYGLEYDADLRLGKITFSTSGAYNEAKLNGNFCNFQFSAANSSISQLSSCTVGVTFGTPPVAQVAAVDGTRLPRQPRFKGTGAIRYDTHFGDYSAYVQGAANYQTSATQDLNVYNNNLLVCPGVTSTTACTTPGFMTFDFSGGFSKGNWHVTLFIQNAFDGRGELTKNTFCSITFCSNSSRTFVIKPQFFGVRLGQKF